MAVNFKIDERTALRLRRKLGPGTIKRWGKRCRLRCICRTSGRLSRFGKVELGDFAIDVNDGTCRLRAIFPNNDGFLVPGLFCIIRLQIGEPYKALLVPSSAVVGPVILPDLLVVDADNVVKRQRVELENRKVEIVGGSGDDLKVVKTQQA